MVLLKIKLITMKNKPILSSTKATLIIGLIVLVLTILAIKDSEGMYCRVRVVAPSNAKEIRDFDLVARFQWCV